MCSHNKLWPKYLECVLELRGRKRVVAERRFGFGWGLGWGDRGKA